MINEQKDTVATKHASYDGLEAQRQIVEDLEGGAIVLRSGSKRTTYLPQFPAESSDSYKVRCDTATLVNLYQKTKDVMVGLTFQGQPKAAPVADPSEPGAPPDLEDADEQSIVKLGDDVPPAIVELCENIDNAGTHLDVFAREVFEEYFDGFAVIIADSPNATASDLGQQKAMGLRPYLKYYEASDVINWRYQVNPVSKAKELCMLVLRECSDEAAGVFVVESVTRYRAFFWDNGVCRWQLWREVKDEKSGEKTYVIEQEGVIEKVSAIPAAVVGELGEAPPLMDIALKTVEHFQTYSDYKSIIHKTCVPMPYAKGLATDAGQTIIISPDKLTVLGTDGELGYCEPAGTSIEAVRQSLLDIREDVALVGLQMLASENQGVNLTATEALLDNVGETATLRVMAREMQDELETAFGFLAEMMGLGKDKGGSVTIGTAWSQTAAAADTTGGMVAPPVDGKAPNPEMPMTAKQGQ